MSARKNKNKQAQAPESVQVTHDRLAQLSPYPQHPYFSTDATDAFLTDQMQNGPFHNIDSFELTEYYASDNGIAEDAAASVFAVQGSQGETDLEVEIWAGPNGDGSSQSGGREASSSLAKKKKKARQTSSLTKSNGKVDVQKKGDAWKASTNKDAA